MYNRYTFFWAGPFSQWYKADFKVNEITYCTAEQYMMHQKATTFGDAEIADQILKTTNARQQKSLGRKVKNFEAEKWAAVARDVVYCGNYAKFQQNIHLYEILMSTEETLLVEASPKDKIWGIGLAEYDPRALDSKKWLGTNWLGEVLTKVRDDLKAGILRTENFQWV